MGGEIGRGSGDWGHCRSNLESLRGRNRAKGRLFPTKKSGRKKRVAPVFMSELPRLRSGQVQLRPTMLLASFLDIVRWGAETAQADDGPTGSPRVSGRVVPPAIPAQWSECNVRGGAASSVTTYFAEFSFVSHKSRLTLARWDRFLPCPFGQNEASTRC